jgi:hypothetical protein
MARVIRLDQVGDYANTQMEKLLRLQCWKLTGLRLLAQLIPADFALVGKLVRMLHQAALFHQATTALRHR